MSILPPLERALQVVKTNQYFTLATQDSHGPWAAALAYTLGPPHCLYFFSQKKSRHGQALLNKSKIAGVFYDSTLPPEKVESLQFSGYGELAHNYENISYVLNANGEQVAEEKIQQKLNDTSTLLFRICVEAAYVLDQELYAEKAIDGRQPVSVEKLFSLLITP